MVPCPAAAAARGNVRNEHSHWGTGAQSPALQHTSEGAGT